MRGLAPLIAALAFGAPAAACETALILAVDVSGSVDRGEYLLQTEGIATALADPQVAEALLHGQVALMLIQWSGAGQQAVLVPWRRMLSPDEIARFARTSLEAPRAFEGSDTAPGDLIAFAAAQFAPVADCKRQVIDISGDGQENAGSPTAGARAQAEAAGVVINGIAIEDAGSALAITGFYRRHVVTRTGFVMTARGQADYPPTLKAKLLRELGKPVS